MKFNGKDSNPFDTIEKCSSLLLKNRILVKEIWHPNNIGTYSVTLSIDKGLLISNGKGINKEYALASAYGELFERFLNMAYFRINSQSFYELNCKNPKLSDEFLFSKWCDLSNINNEYINQITSQLNKDYNEHYESWLNIEDKDDKLVLSNRFTDLWYGTNGMCFGNTYCEAMVQGLSEILERYVIYSVSKERIISIQKISIEGFYNENLINSYINILNKENIEVAIVKFKLFFELPVIGIYLVDNMTHNSTLRIGAHPINEIAIERCFTEFLQGKRNPRINTFGHNIEQNANRYFLNGNYQVNNLEFNEENILLENKQNIQDNKSAFEYLVNLFKLMNRKIYIVDNSLNDFLKAYKIIVPGISEVWSTNAPYSKYKYLEVFCEIINRKEKLLKEQILTISKNFNIEPIDSVKHLFDVTFFIDNQVFSGKFYQYTCCYLYQTNQIEELSKYIKCIEDKLSTSEKLLLENLTIFNKDIEASINKDINFYIIKHHFNIQIRMNDSVISHMRKTLIKRRKEIYEYVQ